MVSTSISTSGVLCLVLAAVWSSHLVQSQIRSASSELEKFSKLFEHCDDCKNTVKNTIELAKNFTQASVDFYDLPVPCGLVSGNFDICNVIIDDVQMLIEYNAAEATRFCGNFGFCWRTPRKPFPPAPFPTQIPNKPTRKPHRTTKRPNAPTKKPGKTTKKPLKAAESDDDYEDSNMASFARSSRLRANDRRHVRNSDKEDSSELSNFLQETQSELDPEGLVDTYCYACKTILRQTKNRIVYVDEDKIIHELRNTCKLFSFQMLDYCLDLVNEKPKVLSAMLWDRDPPVVVCDALKQCRFSFCDACIAFTSSLIEKKNPTSESACSHLTEMSKRPCVASLNMKRNTIEKLVQKMLSANGQKFGRGNTEDICFTMEYCPKPDYL